jgi:phenylacetate-CoA ligase
MSEAPLWNADAESPSRAELEKRQDALLPERIRKAYDEGGLYQQHYDAAQVKPQDYTDRADLRRFPLVGKDAVRAHRVDTGDPFGGLSSGVVAGASVSHGTGTSGTPTLQVSTPADREAVADELATMFWMTGVRSESRILAIQNFGVRAELTLHMAALKIGAVQILPDSGSSSIDQLESLRPAFTWAYPGWLDRLAASASDAGKELEALLEPLEALWWGGRYLSPFRREKLQARLNATVYEMGGMGDVGLHTSTCSAQDGMHIREDMFVVEVIDPQTEDHVHAGTPGELVFTSLWDQGMNHVRWRSDDIGLVKTDPCSCGRTTARVFQLGRVWERTVIDGATIMPTQIDDVLYELTEQDVPFQIVRPRDGRRPFVRVAVTDGLDLGEVRDAVGAALGAELDVVPVPTSELVGPPDAKYAHKYAQVKDE